MKKEIEIKQFIEDGEILEFKNDGNQSLYYNHNGKDGDLIVKIKIEDDPNLKRIGKYDILSNHYITLGEAIKGTIFEI